MLVIDEAQNLRNSVLETVRLLSDFEAPPRKLLQIVLSGQPELGDRLSKPELLQLRQRISIVSRLHPLPPAETPAYIDHRLRVAGYAGPPLFESEAIAQIATHSAGIPRNINNICFNALTLAYAKRQKHVDIATVREVVDDLNILAPSSCHETGESFSVDTPSFADAVKPEDQPLREGLYYRTSASNCPEGTTSYSWPTPGMSSSPQFGENRSSVAICDRPLVGNTAPTEQETPSAGTDLRSLKPETPAGVPQEVSESALTVDPREHQNETPATVTGTSTSAPSEDCASAQQCADKAVEPEPAQALATNQQDRISSRVAATHTSDNASKRFQVGAYPGPSEASGFGRARWMSFAVCVSITLSCVFFLWRYAPQHKVHASLPIVAAAQPSSTPLVEPHVDSENAPAKRPNSKEGLGIRTAPGRPAAIARPRRAVAGVISDTFGELNAHPSPKPAEIIFSSDPIVESPTTVAANMNAIIFSGGTQNLATPEAPPSRLDDSGTPSEQDEGGGSALSPQYDTSVSRTRQEIGCDRKCGGRCENRRKRQYFQDENHFGFVHLAQSRTQRAARMEIRARKTRCAAPSGRSGGHGHIPRIELSSPKVPHPQRRICRTLRSDKDTAVCSSSPSETFSMETSP